jgi:hypothetical protein
VRIAVYNLLGQLVETLFDGEQDGGPGMVRWNGNAASGMYFCRIDAVSIGDHNNRYQSVVKMLLLR